MAQVSPHAHIGKGVIIEPYAIVESGAEIGEDCSIEAHAIVKSHAKLGKGVSVGHFSVVGGDPQHLTFDRERSSFVVVGSETRIGEGVTIHRSIDEKGITMIGEKSFLMGNSHVGHDCFLGCEVILANGALLGGHVSLGNQAFIGGGAGIHQFVRIGKGAMIGGMSEVTADVPPHVTISGRNHACGLNLIGLKRRNASNSEISELKKLYRLMLVKPGNLTKRAKEFKGDDGIAKSQIGIEFIDFFLTGKRGFVRSRKV